MKKIHITIYTKEYGKQELTADEWNQWSIWTLARTFHREDGPAIDHSNGTKEWYLNGKHHRIGGPAVESVDGSKIWCINGMYHRTDGPAMEFSDGGSRFYIEGKIFENEEHFSRTMNKIKNMPAALRLTDPRWWVREMK